MSEPRLSIIPGWIITDPRLKGKDLQVLCMLGQNANTRHGWCRRSQVKLAAALGCARSTVQAAIDRLVDIGAVERQEVVSANGRDSAHWYRVVYDSEVSSSAFHAWDEEDQKEFGPMEPDENETPPAGIPAPPADTRPAPPAGSGPAPINASRLTPPAEREEREARERGPFGQDGSVSHAVNAELIKRVQKFVNGDGYREGEWKKWASSTIGHIAKQFASLTPEEQDKACEWRDAFLDKCKRDGVTKPMPVANYFRDKVWEMLTDADKAAVRPVAGGAPATSGGRVVVPVFGPAFGVARAWSLVSGPIPFDLPEDLRERVRATYDVHARRGPHAVFNYLQRLGLEERDGELIFPPDFEAQERARRTIEEGYPEANRLHEAAKERTHVTLPPIFERLKHLCEAVPVGSAMWERWRNHHHERGWPFGPTPHHQKVVFFPKGGPDQLHEFEAAVRTAMGMERGDDDAA